MGLQLESIIGFKRTGVLEELANRIKLVLYRDLHVFVVAFVLELERGN